KPDGGEQGGTSAAPPREDRQDRRPRGGGERDRGPRGGGDRRGGGGERKPAGPLVVVKRASGVIETRGPAGEAPAAAAEAAPATGDAPAAEASAAPAPAPVPTPRPAPAPAPSSALYEEVFESEFFAEMFEAQVKEGGVPTRRSVRVGEKVTGK